MADEKVAGTPDEQYDLVSVLYHSLQGAETGLQYANDARQAGDAELSQFFQQTVADDINRAERAKQLLAGRLQLARH